MVSAKLVIVVLATLIGTVPAIGPVVLIKSSVTVINEVLSLVTGVDGVIDLIKSDKTDEIFQEDVRKQLSDIYAACLKIDALQGSIANLNEVVKENTDKILKSIQFNNALRVVAEFKKNVDYVNKVYNDQFTAVWYNIQNYSRWSVNKHFRGIVEDSVFLRALSDLLSDITSSPKSQSSIFAAMSKYYDTQNGYQFRCENISPLDDLHIFYGSVITTFARGYAVLLMSYEYLKMKSRDFQFNQDRQNTAFRNFKEAVEAITEHAKIDFDSIENSDYRASFACDPKDWAEGENYIRVKNYVTIPKYSKLDVTYDPNGVARPKEYDCPNGWLEYNTTSNLNARSFVCTSYKESLYADINGSKRPTCMKGETTDDFMSCSHDSNSDPFLSIRKLYIGLQECDTRKNEVVTDARFHEHNIIMIKVQCGVLENANVNPKYLRWIEDTEQILKDDPKKYVVLSSKLKSFNLDNVVIPNGEIVTGVGFEVIDDHIISLVVKGNKVNNFFKGNSFGEGVLYSAPKSNNPRKNIDITNIERPPKKMSQTSGMSKAGETYINLTVSKGSSVYNNQAIVPYFDMTPFKLNESASFAAPLGGLGLFYKSLPGYTGFLAFKHLSPTYVHFVDTLAKS